MRLLVGEPLAHGARYRFHRALGIVRAECGAVAIAEVELRQIAVQVMLSAMLVDTAHSRA